MADFNTQVIEEFRSNDGQVGGPFENMSLLLLHHTGAKSGQERIAPLAYLDDGDRYVIFGSKAGAPTHPAWYHNLLAHPETTIEVGTDTIAVTAHEATGRRARSAVRGSGASAPRSSGTTRRRPAAA